MNRHTRYQGAIVKDYHLLLLYQRIDRSGRLVWLFPGGNIEHGETEEECVCREMKEETNLDVKVRELLLDEPDLVIASLQVRTYLCEVLSGEAKPGYEPERMKTIESHEIVKVRWFDLRNESTWDTELINDPIIYLPLQRLRRKLGYLT